MVLSIQKTKAIPLVWFPGFEEFISFNYTVAKHLSGSVDIAKTTKVPSILLGPSHTGGDTSEHSLTL